MGPATWCPQDKHVPQAPHVPLLSKETQTLKTYPPWGHDHKVQEHLQCLVTAERKEVPQDCTGASLLSPWYKVSVEMD